MSRFLLAPAPPSTLPLKQSEGQCRKALERSRYSSSQRRIARQGHTIRRRQRKACRLGGIWSISRGCCREKLPPSSALEAPLVKALRERAAPMTNRAIDEFVAQELKLAAALLEVLHVPGRGTRTEFAYRMALARTRLKSKGVIERAGPSAWRLASADDQK